MSIKDEPDVHGCSHEYTCGFCSARKTEVERLKTWLGRDGWAEVERLRAENVTLNQAADASHDRTLQVIERAERAEARLREVVEAAKTAADGMEADAVEIRGDWSDFDGRSNLDNVSAWLKPLRAALAAAQPEEKK